MEQGISQSATYSEKVRRSRRTSAAKLLGTGEEGRNARKGTMATAEEDGESTEVQQPANGGAQPGGGASKALEKLKENLEECVDKQSKLKSAEDSPRLRSLMASEYGLTGRIVLARVVEANCNDSEAKERIRGIISDSDDESGILSLLVRWIDDAHADQKYSAIIRMLSALRVLPISIEHLSATNAGSTINKLRKADDVGPDIQQMAGDVVKRWRVRELSFGSTVMSRWCTACAVASHLSLVGIACYTRSLTHMRQSIHMGDDRSSSFACPHFICLVAICGHCEHQRSSLCSCNA